ncbi:MAG: hypothetical protein N2201_04715 [candidate division WOR-3 bacterium]|nr:hypothetical protein [candidate division WOR-3 bacterium]
MLITQSLIIKLKLPAINVSFKSQNLRLSHFLEDKECVDYAGADCANAGCANADSVVLCDDVLVAKHNENDLCADTVNTGKDHNICAFFRVLKNYLLTPSILALK